MNWYVLAQQYYPGRTAPQQSYGYPSPAARPPVATPQKMPAKAPAAIVIPPQVIQKAQMDGTDMSDVGRMPDVKSVAHWAVFHTLRAFLPHYRQMYQFSDPQAGYATQMKMVATQIAMRNAKSKGFNVSQVPQLVNMEFMQTVKREPAWRRLPV